MVLGITKPKSCWITHFDSFKMRNIRSLSEGDVLKPYAAKTADEFTFT